jgi:hypothetical protein
MTGADRGSSLYAGRQTARIAAACRKQTRNRTSRRFAHFLCDLGPTASSPAASRGFGDDAVDSSVAAITSPQTTRGETERAARSLAACRT